MPPKYQEIHQHISYIIATMKEALRLYPVIGFPLFHATPKDEVVSICGFNLPANTESVFTTTPSVAALLYGAMTLKS
jgi:cytochrome P450